MAGSFSGPGVHTRGTGFTISSHDILAGAIGFAAPATNAYPVANLAFHVPFTVSTSVTAYEGFAVTGTATSGNFDVGIYDSGGTRLTSAGATAHATASVVNTTAMTNYELRPGIRYYMSLSGSTISADYMATTSAAGLYESMGVLTSVTSYVLPTTPTLIVTAQAYLPLFGLNLRSTAL